MRKAGFIVLMLLLFSVTIAVSAEDFAFSNPFEYSVFTETTAFDGGVIDLYQIDESVAVIAVESIEPSFLDILTIAWHGTVDIYYIDDQRKWFTHPAVLGIV